MTQEQKDKLEELLTNFHSDDTLYNETEYKWHKRQIFNFVETLVGRVELPVKPACEHCKFFNKTRTSSEYLNGHCSKLSKSFNKDFWCKYFEASKSV